jgi:hypothetical protein
MHNIQTKNIEKIKKTVSPKQNHKKVIPQNYFRPYSVAFHVQAGLIIIAFVDLARYYSCVRARACVCVCGGTDRSVIMTVDIRAGIQLAYGKNKGTGIIV